jgi:hypothetical protein
MSQTRIPQILQAHAVQTATIAGRLYVKDEWTKNGVYGAAWILAPKTVRSVYDWLGY